MRCAEGRACQWIPASSSRECSLDPDLSAQAPRKKTPDTYRSTRASEPSVLADGDIRERARGSRVDEWVQETEDGFACSNELVVDECDDARERGRRGRGATDESRLTGVDDVEVPALDGDLQIEMLVFERCALRINMKYSRQGIHDQQS